MGVTKNGDVLSRVRSWLLPLAGGLALAGGVLPAAGAARITTDLDWPQYLNGPQHSSVSRATAFTPVNSGMPAPTLVASPTVAAGRVYIGAQSGGFYALNESTGQVEWSRQLDTCPAHGITSTAAV